MGSKTLKSVEKDIEIMQTHEIFNQGIPRGTVGILAAKLRKSTDLIRRWQREPLSGDNEYATGKMNPLDRFLICYEHFLAHNPAAAEMVIQLLIDIRNLFNREQGKARNLKECFSKMVREVSEVIQAAGTDASIEEIEREGNEAIAAIHELILQCKLNSRKGEALSDER
jgi:hypothetical protein